MTNIGQIRNLILKHLPFLPNNEQIALIEGLAYFTDQKSPMEVLVVNGYAGTVKHQLWAHMLKL